MADPTWLAIRTAVQTILETVSGIGTVTIYQAQPPPWERAQGGQPGPFWEVSIGTEQRSQFGAPRKMERANLVVVTGKWPVPAHVDDRIEREEEWETVIVGILDALSDERTLGGVVDHMTDLPDLLVNEPRPFADADSEKLCYFCQIQLSARADTEYAAP